MSNKTKFPGGIEAPSFTPSGGATELDPITEGGAAPGGTNDGDIPSLTATNTADLAAASGTYVQAEASGTRTAVNQLRADNIALRAGVRENAAKLNEVIAILEANGFSIPSA